MLQASELKSVIAAYEEKIKTERETSLQEYQTVPPDQSDVEPVYMAVVDEADKETVLDLLALAPAQTSGHAAAIFRRTGKGWERDDTMLKRVRSVNPPPVCGLERTKNTQMS